ncbi:SPFH domain-containing protein [Sphaerisporangium sp. TRM90804]|uniref:SPFH domain-containing protein n=1 Tax=Sphaerisporangium sp. TRM90804 TaxID=3031113 RepID=UPI002449F063|nr:SPFH domain-containing protein [Sphaerisporangium sp. TRM90804]MDH2424219.1 SPFH domain-containing protein [Sphaerisporangium sp. TRM90804]
MPPAQVSERRPMETTGWPWLGLGVALVVGGVVAFVRGIADTAPGVVVTGIALVLLGILVLLGLMAIAPGEARVVQLLGRYMGTARSDGLRWTIPFTWRTKISTRIRNHETGTAKVNDVDGNPIEIAAVVVWQVQDTAKAKFEVDDFVEFVAIQTDTAVRHIAGNYPYDSHQENQLSLRENADEITGKLSAEIAARVHSAGVRVIESRITRLAYAPEIAQAMLRRQQAGAVVAARRQIVDGAVGMVELALERLDSTDVVHLDDERKAAMVSNLLVILCGDRDAQPVVNTGSLYQ